MGVELLTERHLKIPHALAARRAKPGTDEFDELVSYGSLILVKAALTYDPAKGTSVETHLFGSVQLALISGRRRGGWRPSAHSLDHPDTPLQAVAPREPQREDLSEVWALARRHLDPLDYAIVVAHYRDGLGLPEIAERLGGRDPSGLRQRLGRALVVLRRSGAMRRYAR